MKKIIIFFLFSIMLLGIGISIANFVASDLNASANGACGWVKYLPDVPDCRGEGKTCYDFTGC